MLSTSSIRKLADYILLNACSVSSSGLYNGKAGMALALFEVARYLQDEYIDEQAFNLFEEALVTQNEDIGFENGLSGVGYMLLYLIGNDFIDADFEELFDENRIKIETGLIAPAHLPPKEQLVQYLRVVYYLCMVNKKITGVKTKLVAKSILKETDKLLVENFSTLETRNVTLPKIDILNSLESYLKVADFCCFFEPSVELLERYATLYKQSKLVSNFAIGYYLTNIAKRTGNTDIETVGVENKAAAIRNTYRETLSLTQRVDLLWLLHQNAALYKNEIAYLEKDFVEITDEKAVEQILVQSMHPIDFIAGYQSGIARFLLYYVYRNTTKDGKQRFYFL